MTDKKYTVTVNHGEYAIGIYDTEGDAEKYMAKRIKDDEPDVTDDMTTEEILEFDGDGYYRVLEIDI